MTKSNIRGEALQESAHAQYRPDVSIVIVSWNVRELLEQCLRSIGQAELSSRLDLQILVIDNASRDGSVEAAGTFAGVELVALGRNIGYGRANNIGLRRAEGRYILILNPDTVLLPGALSDLVSFADANPCAGIVAPRLLNADGSVQTSAFRFPTLLMAAIDLYPLPNWVPGRIRLWINQSRHNGRYPNEQLADQPFRIEHPLGACMLVRREAYADAGGFDEKIFMYSEEIDLAMRFAQYGWECWQLPSAQVVHLGGQSTAQAPIVMQRELWKSRLYLYSKHKGKLQRSFLAAMLLVAQILRGVSVTIKGLLKRDKSQETERQLTLARTLIKVALSR